MDKPAPVVLRDYCKMCKKVQNFIKMHTLHGFYQCATCGRPKRAEDIHHGRRNQ